MKDVATLRQLSEAGQLVMATEFQRNAIWPRSAKAYLIDTILHDRPIPYLYFRRSISAQTGKSVYEVIDGQQRLRAVLEFLDNRFGLTETEDRGLRKKRFDDLRAESKTKILSYDFYVEELTGYSDNDIRDMFVRMNKYVVKLSLQEIRHAKFDGRFAKFVDKMAGWDFWTRHRTFTPHQIRRMRAVEFSAELVVLLVEGAQDKKAAVDLYYGQYESSLPFGSRVEKQLQEYLRWIDSYLPDLRRTRFRKPTDLYALIGALDRLAAKRGGLRSLHGAAAATALKKLDLATQARDPTGRAAKYVAAASQQTDNIAPRETRIEILSDVIANA